MQFAGKLELEAQEQRLEELIVLDLLAVSLLCLRRVADRMSLDRREASQGWKRLDLAPAYYRMG